MCLTDVAAKELVAQGMRRGRPDLNAIPQLFFKEQVTCGRHGKLVHRCLHPSGGTKARNAYENFIGFLLKASSKICFH